MATSCIRPADCVGGNNAFLEAHRGVRATPAQMQKQDGQVRTTSVPGQSLPVRGRPNGRQRGRQSSPAAGSTRQKPVMENVMILKRGEQIQPKVMPLVAAKSGAQAEKADELVAAANQRGAQAEKVVVVAASDKYITRTERTGMENAEPVIAADQHGPDTRTKKAEAAEQHGADATKAKVLACEDQCVPPAKEEEVKHILVAATPPVGYSGPPFDAAPEPRDLPIPVLLLKGRGVRLRPRDNERAVPVAA